MGNKIDAIDSAKSAKQLKAAEKAEKAKEAKEAKKAEEAEKAKKSKEADSFQSTKTGLSDYKIESYVKTYINNLIAKYDGYDDIISRLRSYLGDFDIDKFRKEYSELSSNADLSMALYTDTKKLL